MQSPHADLMPPCTAIMGADSSDRRPEQRGAGAAVHAKEPHAGCHRDNKWRQSHAWPQKRLAPPFPFLVWDFINTDSCLTRGGADLTGIPQTSRRNEISHTVQMELDPGRKHTSNALPQCNCSGFVFFNRGRSRGVTPWVAPAMGAS